MMVSQVRDVVVYQVNDVVVSKRIIMFLSQYLNRGNDSKIIETLCKLSHLKGVYM